MRLWLWTLKFEERKLNAWLLVLHNKSFIQKDIDKIVIPFVEESFQKEIEKYIIEAYEEKTKGFFTVTISDRRC